MKKRILICLLSVLLLTPVLASCSSNQGAEETKASSDKTEQSVTADETETAEIETERVYPKYEKNYNGADFNILYFDAVQYCGWGNTIPCDIDQEEITGEPLSDAVYERNAAVEEMYNVKLLSQAYTDAGNCSLIEQQVVANSCDFDAFFPCWGTMTSMVNKGYAADLTSYFDFNMPWYDSKAQRAFSILGKSYATISDAHYMDKMLSIVILFNKNMASDYQLGDLYQSVLDGSWTFDKMHDMCVTVASDLNGDGIYDRDDRFGMINQNDGVYQLYHSAGEQYCVLNEDGVPTLTLSGERSINVLMTIYDFMNEKNLFFNRQSQGASTIDVCNMFAANNALFIMRQIQCAFELRDMEADFGIIPTPKMTEDQESYYTPIGYTVALCEAVPKLVKDMEMSAVVLDTLAAEGYYNVNGALYDKVLGDKLARDEVSKANLDMIFNNRVYDIGCIFNFGGIANTMMGGFNSGSDQVASLIKRSEKPVEKQIEKFMETLTENE